MPFNPFKYQYEATYLRDENDCAILSLRRGTEESTLAFPKKLLPPEFTLGSTNVLMLEPQEVLKKNEAEVLKQLLEELVR